jgi:hypothetical protein
MNRLLTGRSVYSEMTIEKADRLTDIISFECEECGAVFRTEEEALECEELHEEEEHFH